MHSRPARTVLWLLLLSPFQERSLNSALASYFCQWLGEFLLEDSRDQEVIKVKLASSSSLSRYLLSLACHWAVKCANAVAGNEDNYLLLVLITLHTQFQTPKAGWLTVVCCSHSRASRPRLGFETNLQKIYIPLRIYITIVFQADQLDQSQDLII